MSSMTQRIDARLSQAPVMTPRLQEAIRLLQLSHQDLVVYLEEQLGSNPFLEEEAGGGKEGPAVTSRGEFLEASHTRQLTLTEHLLRQAALLFEGSAEWSYAQYFIYSREPDGYWREPLEETGRKLGVSAIYVESILERLQSLEPAGIFARSLLECLMLQLRDKNLWHPDFEKIFSKPDLLASSAWSRLIQVTGLTSERLKECLQMLKEMDPAPGREEAGCLQSVVADVMVELLPEGGYRVELNTQGLPRLLVNNLYYQEIKDRLAKEEERRFVQTAYHDAQWLLRSVTQRAQTMLDVASAIMRHQRGFLDQGVSALRPLTLAEIALEVGVHESTVSRIVAHKHAATPRGTLPLKYFFPPKSPQGEDCSNAHIKDVLRKIIAKEPSERPYSDEKLVALLGNVGLSVARRTVAKYRDALGIPPTSRRRKRTLF